MLNDDGYVLREKWTVERVKIPEGQIKCPDCNGSGRQVKIYKDPGPNEYMTCLRCMGKGFVPAKTSEVEQK